MLNDEMDDLEEFVSDSLDVAVEGLIHSVSQGVATATQKIRHSAFRGCFDLEQRLEMLEEHADATSEFLQEKIGKCKAYSITFLEKPEICAVLLHHFKFRKIKSIKLQKH